MAEKVKIEPRPYSALAIFAFCQEYINDSNRHDPKLAAIHEALDEYKDQIFTKLTNNQLDDAIL